MNFMAFATPDCANSENFSQTAFQKGMLITWLGAVFGK